MMCPMSTTMPKDRRLADMVRQELEQLAFNKSIYDLDDPKHAKELRGKELWKLARAKVVEDLAAPAFLSEELN